MNYQAVTFEDVELARAGDEGARERCHLAVRPFALHYAKQAYRSHKVKASMEYDDLVGYGHVAIAKAINSYAADRGATFATYAAWKVRGAISDAVRNRGPVREAQAAAGIADPLPFSQITAPGGTREFAGRNDSPAASAASKELTELLLAAVRPDFRETARLWAVGGMNLPELSRHLGVTTNAISNRLGQAVRSMREEAARLGCAIGPVWGVGKVSLQRRRTPKGGFGRPGKPVESDMGDRFASAAAASVHFGLRDNAVSKGISGGLRVAGRRWFFASEKEVAA